MKHPANILPRASYGSHIRSTLKLAWPVILGQLGHVVIGNADTIMIGKLGATELAAASLANGIFFLFTVIGIGVCIAISPLASQAIGAGESRLYLRNLLHQSVLLTFYLGLIMIGAIIAAGFTFPYLGQEPQVVTLAQSYLNILAISALPMLIFLAYKHFIEGFEYTLPGMLVMALIVALNILLNWLFIYGNAGFPTMGLNGAGWATLIARIVGMILIAVYTHTATQFRAYNYFSNLLQHQKKVIKEILKIGLPSGLMYFFEIGAFSGAVILAGRIGKDAQSAHQIAIQIASFTFMFYLGISSAASIRVGNAHGRNDWPNLKRAGIAGIISGLAFIAIFILIIIPFREILPALYIDDDHVVQIAIPLLLIAAFFQLFDGIQAIIAGILRGMSDVRIPTLITFIAYWIVGLPLAWLIGESQMSVQGIWYGLTAGLAFSATFLTWRFLQKTKDKQ
ncbi:MAG TPA: MATE family efflux transporter [Bacteroidetes bacterium]|nr:MATE family efflux transporter [Bacteroidota bacterium]